MTENAVKKLPSDEEVLAQHKQHILAYALTTAYAVAGADMGMLGEQLHCILPGTKVLELVQVLVTHIDAAAIPCKLAIVELAKARFDTTNLASARDLETREYLQHVRDMVAKVYAAVGEDNLVLAHSLYTELGKLDFIGLLVSMQAILAQAPQGGSGDA
jgi:hypothetical protein